MTIDDFSTAQATHSRLSGEAIASLVKLVDEQMDNWWDGEAGTIVDEYISRRWSLERERWVREYEEIMGKPYPDRVLG